MPRLTQSEYDNFLARRADASAKDDHQHLTDSRAVASESKLRAQVIDHCRQKGWLVFSGTTAHATGRTVGEPDLTIAADLGLVYFIELKSKTGKLRPEQAAVAAWLQKLGHAWFLIRSLKEFVERTTRP